MPVISGSLGFDVDPMATHINHVERVKLSVSFDVPGTHEVRLVDVVTAECLPEVRILDSLGYIGGFF